VALVSRRLDRIRVTFDEPSLVANAGLLLVATLAERLSIEQLVNDTVRLTGRVGGALPGRKVLTLVHAIVAVRATSTTPTCCAPVPARRCSVIE
jgi:hypothetical protein